MAEQEPVYDHAATLYARQVAVRCAVGGYLVNGLTVYRPAVGRMVYELRARVLTHRLPPARVTQDVVFHHRVAATTWNFFKHRHTDAWWLRWLTARRPARFHTRRVTRRVIVTLDRFQTYPEAPVLGLGRIINHHTIDTEVGDLCP